MGRSQHELAQVKFAIHLDKRKQGNILTD